MVVDDILQVGTLYHDHLDTQRHRGGDVSEEKNIITSNLFTDFLLSV